MESVETLYSNIAREIGNTVFNDDDGNVNHGVWLVLTDATRQHSVLTGSARSNPSISYSRSDTLRVSRAESSLMELEVDILNIGDTDSQITNLLFILWGKEERQIGFYPYPLNISVPCPTNFEVAGPQPEVTPVRNILVPLPLGVPAAGNVPITNPSEITHIYAIAFDAMLAPLDRACSNFLEETLRGNKAVAENPCRLSTQIACWTPPDPAFRLSGNNIRHNLSGMVECFLTSVDAGVDASFGLHSPTTARWHSNLLSTRWGLLEGGHPLPVGDVEFLLGSSNSGDVGSANTSNCRIKLYSDGDIVELQWEDGSDGDFNDYVVRVIHR